MLLLFFLWNTLIIFTVVLAMPIDDVNYWLTHQCLTCFMLLIINFSISSLDSFSSKLAVDDFFTHNWRNNQGYKQLGISRSHKCFITYSWYDLPPCAWVWCGNENIEYEISMIGFLFHQLLGRKWVLVVISERFTCFLFTHF